MAQELNFFGAGSVNNGQGDITQLLDRMERGDSDAEERLLAIVYDELRSLAAHKLRNNHVGLTLTPTVLVHEAYLRVLRGSGIPLQNRRHLFFAFGQAMWRIVVEHQRRKRPRTVDALPDGIEFDLPETSMDELPQLDRALGQLKDAHPREYEIAILRKILGFTIAETAELIGASSATVKRGWVFAKAVLTKSLREACDS